MTFISYTWYYTYTKKVFVVIDEGILSNPTILAENVPVYFVREGTLHWSHTISAEDLAQEMQRIIDENYEPPSDANFVVKSSGANGSTEAVFFDEPAVRLRHL